LDWEAVLRLTFVQTWLHGQVCALLVQDGAQTESHSSCRSGRKCRRIAFSNAQNLDSSTFAIRQRAASLHSREHAWHSRAIPRFEAVRLFLSSTWGRADQQTSHDSNGVWGVLFCAQIGSRDWTRPGISLHCPYWPAILRDQRIDGKQRDTLYRRLCHQHAIERILVKRRQALDGDNVI